MKSSILKSVALIATMSLLLAGCASGNGGQVLSGVLQGIGQCLSGL